MYTSKIAALKRLVASSVANFVVVIIIESFESLGDLMGFGCSFIYM